MSYPRECWRIVWMGLWAGLVEDVPSKGVETRWSLRCLPTQTILWFFGNKHVLWSLLFQQTPSFLPAGYLIKSYLHYTGNCWIWKLMEITPAPHSSYIFTSNFFFFLYFGLVCCFIISFFFSLLRQNSSSPFLTAFYNGNHCRKACKTPVAWARGEVLLSVEMC